MSKIIYQPKGKAAEYSKWAANFYNGCSSGCEYCYNRHGRAAGLLGADKPTLKKGLENEASALSIFKAEVSNNLMELQRQGIFFSFVSDPFLPETIKLNINAMTYCVRNSIPVYALTKQADFINKITGLLGSRIAFGFTLTGHDELEPGAASNIERIWTMRRLHIAGFKTFASIEPIIDFKSSLDMIEKTAKYCDLYKIGLQSGKKYNPAELKKFITDVHTFAWYYSKIYWKDSLLKQAGINRASLSHNCVGQDYDIFNNW